MAVSGTFDFSSNLGQNLHPVSVKIVSESKQFVANWSSPTAALFRTSLWRQNTDAAELLDFCDCLVCLLVELLKDILEPLLVFRGLA